MPGVESLVALEPNQRGVEEHGQHLGHLCLAHPGLALEEERPAQLQPQMDGNGQAPVGDVFARVEGLLDCVDVGWKRFGHGGSTLVVGGEPLPPERRSVSDDSPEEGR